MKIDISKSVILSSFFAQYPDLDHIKAFEAMVPMYEYMTKQLKMDMQTNHITQMMNILTKNEHAIQMLNQTVVTSATQQDKTLQTIQRGIETAVNANDKSTAQVTRELETQIKTAVLTIKQDNSGLVKETQHAVIDTINQDQSELVADIVDQIDSKIDIMFEKNKTLTPQCMMDLERRMSEMMRQLQATANETKQCSETASNSIEKVLNQFRNSSERGTMGENVLHLVLEEIYPGCVLDTTKLGHTGDFIIQRKQEGGIDWPNVLIETKAYDVRNPVPTEEVRKFQEDVIRHKCCGVLLSQTSAIRGKADYQLEINRGNVCIYVHNAKYQRDKIELALNAVYAIHGILVAYTADNESGEECISLTSHDLDVTKVQYELFLKHKELLIKDLREGVKRQVAIANKLDVPYLKAILDLKSGNVGGDTTQFDTAQQCPSCEFTSTSARGLSRHMATHRPN